jgi:hypothetical protein
VCRAGQFVDAVSGLRQQGLADPALPASEASSSSEAAAQPLLPSFGVWAQQQQQQQENRPLASSGKQRPAAASQGVPAQQQEGAEQPPATSSAMVSNDTAAGFTTQDQQQAPTSEQGYVDVVTAVWRAGLAGASTDHSSICFNVDLGTGALSPGVTANHWYRLGLQGLGRLDAAAARVWQSHPDTGKQVAGELTQHGE